jgi:hypothetical protein
MTPLQTCLRKADELIVPSKRNLFDPVRLYVETAEGQKQRRVFILADAAVRTIAPMALDREFPEQAAILRALPEIVSVETARRASRSAYAADVAAPYAYADAYAADAAVSATYAADAADAAYAAAATAADAAYDAAYAVNAAAQTAYWAARVTQDDRPWLALRDAMLRAACLDGACCIHPDCRGEGEFAAMYPELGRNCLIEADPLGARKNPTEMSTGTAALAGAAIGAVLGGLVYLLIPKNVSKGTT